MFEGPHAGLRMTTRWTSVAALVRVNWSDDWQRWSRARSRSSGWRQNLVHLPDEPARGPRAQRNERMMLFSPRAFRPVDLPLRRSPVTIIGVL
jgi:hypothetical protein